MKVLFFLRYSRKAASSRIRGFYIAEELVKKQIMCGITFGHSPLTYLSFLARLLFYDIVYFQKCNSRYDVLLNRLARAIGKKTIFDLDDAPFGVAGKQRAEKQTIEMMKISSGVVVASHELMDYARQFNTNVHRIPTSINLRYYTQCSPTNQNREITLGWVGNGPGYKNDLKMLIEPIERISEKHRIRLVIIGALGDQDIHQSFSQMKNTTVEIIDTLDWADPHATPKAIAVFDIGLYPLIENKYNIYKGGYKALEYMATGAAVVAAPVGENRFIVDHERDGYLAQNPGQWYEYLLKLIEDPSTREKMIRAGRIKIEKEYSTEQVAVRLMEIFKGLEK